MYESEWDTHCEPHGCFSYHPDNPGTYTQCLPNNHTLTTARGMIILGIPPAIIILIIYWRRARNNKNSSNDNSQNTESEGTKKSQSVVITKDGKVIRKSKDG